MWSTKICLINLYLAFITTNCDAMCNMYMCLSVRMCVSQVFVTIETFIDQCEQLCIINVWSHHIFYRLQLILTDVWNTDMQLYQRNFRSAFTITRHNQTIVMMAMHMDIYLKTCQSFTLHVFTLWNEFFFRCCWQTFTWNSIPNFYKVE